MVNNAYKLEHFHTVADLINAQISFQHMLNSEIPSKIVTFEDIQESLKHSLFQRVEIQEFNEANENDKKEEFIDCLLFLINKYIYLGIKDTDDYPALMHIYYENDFVDKSIRDLFIEEDNRYLSIIRHCTIYKPWKVRQSESCVLSEQSIQNAFLSAMATYNIIANKIFINKNNFVEILTHKLNKNITRQLNNY